MKANNKLLLRLWIPTILILVLLCVAIFKNVGENLVFAVIPAFVFGGFIIRRNLMKKGLQEGIKKALQQSGPDELINVITRPLISSSGKSNLTESYTAYYSALSYVLYGRYPEAAEVMSKIAWASKEPMFQALDLHIKSLINYFTGNVLAGLTDVRKANHLAATSAFPGSKKSKDSYEAYIQVGQLLSGITSDEIIHSLESKFNKMPLLDQLLLAWGLMHGYKHRNQLDEFNRLLTFCRVNAPHCHGLFMLNMEEETEDRYEISF